MDEKIIGHLDMDAFFAAVEERDKPWLKGFPIAVGADPKGGLGRGVLSTANYAARKYGLRSALPIRKAWEYSEAARKRGEKGVIFVSGSGRRYGEVSKVVFDILRAHVDDMQSSSIDEAYFDITSCGSFEKARVIAEKIKKEIQKKTKLSCSIGIGPNKMIAKIASDHDKPNGLTVVPPESVLDFLAPLHVRVIPGVGPKMQQRLKQMNIEHIKDARAYSWEDLYTHFGEHGFSLYGKIHGSGSTVFKDRARRKSIGQHETFYEDTLDMEYIHEVIKRMAEHIMNTLSKKGFKGCRTVVLTVRFSDFDTKTRSLTGDDSIENANTLSIRGLKLLLPFFDNRENPGRRYIRMIGLRAENLYD